MIVQPNFLDHWKTRLLQTELGDDQLAHTYVLRLWGHCQEQKTHRFTNLSSGALAAICRFNGAPEQLWLSLQTAGFIAVKKQSVEVHEWDKYNSGLLTSWKNGSKGGRPKKTREKPGDNPRETQRKPKPNPDETDREDREDGIDKKNNTNQGDGSTDSKTVKNPEVEFAAVIELYNQICTPALPAANLTEIRKPHIRARWLSAGDEPLKWFENLFKLAAASDFLCARAPASGGNAQPFRANFDWLIGPKNSQKTIEGNYTNRTKKEDSEWTIK